MARDERERRLLVRRLVRVGGDRLMMFSLVDDHLHGAIRAERPGRLADDDAVTRVGVARLVDLAAGVYAVGPTLEGRSAPVVAARSLAVHTATRAGYGAPIIARFVGVGPRAVRYLARRRLDPRAVLALRRRLALEERVQRGKPLGSRPISA